MPEIKQKKDLHLIRKLLHLVPGVSLVVVVNLNLIPLGWVLMGLSVALILVCFAEVLRLNHKHFNRWTIQWSRHIIRKDELKQISGIPYYLMSCLLVLAVCIPPIASLSILYLALGDPLASFMGIKFGENSYKFKNKKSLVGTMSGIITCMLATVVYGFCLNWSVNELVILSLVGGLAGGLSETFTPQEINDNLFIPVVSAIALSVVYANFI